MLAGRGANRAPWNQAYGGPHDQRPRPRVPPVDQGPALPQRLPPRAQPGDRPARGDHRPDRGRRQRPVRRHGLHRARPVRGRPGPAGHGQGAGRRPGVPVRGRPAAGQSLAAIRTGHLPQAHAPGPPRRRPAPGPRAGLADGPAGVAGHPRRAGPRHPEPAGPGQDQVPRPARPGRQPPGAGLGLRPGGHPAHPAAVRPQLPRRRPGDHVPGHRPATPPDPGDLLPRRHRVVLLPDTYRFKNPRPALASLLI